MFTRNAHFLASHKALRVAWFFLFTFLLPLHINLVWFHIWEVFVLMLLTSYSFFFLVLSRHWQKVWNQVTAFRNSSEADPTVTWNVVTGQFSLGRLRCGILQKQKWSPGRYQRGQRCVGSGARVLHVATSPWPLTFDLWPLPMTFRFTSWDGAKLPSLTEPGCASSQEQQITRPPFFCQFLSDSVHVEPSFSSRSWWSAFPLTGKTTRSNNKIYFTFPIYWLMELQTKRVNICK